MNHLTRLAADLPTLEHDPGMDHRSTIMKRKFPFQPRSDDSDNIWEVHEITQESDTEYKVRWVGTDPQTGEPWAQSWVLKSDCSDDLVLDWNAKRKPSRPGDPAGPERKREDLAESVDISVKTAKAKPGKKQQSEVDKDASLDAILFGAQSSLKVGPPRGVRTRHSTHSHPLSRSPSPVVRLNGGCTKAVEKAERGPANCLSGQSSSALEKQLSNLPKSSDERTSTEAQTGSGSAGGQPLFGSKRKREPEGDSTEPIIEVLDETSVKTAKQKPAKKQKQEVVKKDTSLDATLFGTHPSLKVGPPRGVRTGHSVHSHPFSHSPSPAVRSSGGRTKAVKAEQGPAKCPSEQKSSALERRLSSLPGSSDEGTSAKAEANWGTTTASSSEDALREYKIQFTRIAANILTLHGLVKKVDVQLEEATKELRGLEALFQ